MQDAPSTLQEADPAPVKTVLVVEDDAAIGEALQAFLRDTTDYQVIYVSDGFAALKMVRTLIPHLVVLDYQFPGMDGLECLEQLRASKGMEQTPVIFMSAALAPIWSSLRNHLRWMPCSRTSGGFLGTNKSPSFSRCPRLAITGSN